MPTCAWPTGPFGPNIDRSTSPTGRCRHGVATAISTNANIYGCPHRDRIHHRPTGSLVPFFVHWPSVIQKAGYPGRCFLKLLPSSATMGYPTVSPVAPILVNHNGNPKSLILTIPQEAMIRPGAIPARLSARKPAYRILHDCSNRQRRNCPLLGTMPEPTLPRAGRASRKSAPVLGVGVVEHSAHRSDPVLQWKEPANHTE